MGQLPRTEAETYRRLLGVVAQLRNARDGDAVVRAWLREAQTSVRADDAVFAVLDSGQLAARVVHQIPVKSDWDHEWLWRIATSRPASFPLGVLAASVQRYGRDWGVIALRVRTGTFVSHSRRVLQWIADELTAAMERIDRARVLDIRARVDRRMLRDLPVKDLYYLLFDALHQLARYDHSASLYVMTSERPQLHLVAEQIAWQKGRSDRISSEVSVPDHLRPAGGPETSFRVDRRARGWVEARGRGGVAMADWLDAWPAGPPGQCGDGVPPAVGSQLMVPLWARGQWAGLLVVASCHPGGLGSHEEEFVTGVSANVSTAVERALASERIQARALESERGSVVALIARGVAHDVNNHLGGMLPLVEQMQTDLVSREFNHETLRSDLEHLHHLVAVSSGVMARMLAFARGSARHEQCTDPGRALSDVLELSAFDRQRQDVELVRAGPDTFPMVRGSQTELFRVLQNLIANSLQAMPSGGVLWIKTEVLESVVRVEIEDSGQGVTPEQLGQLGRPFMSGRAGGTGLGIATCASILADIGGGLEFEHREPAPGLRAVVLFRVHEEGSGHES